MTHIETYQLAEGNGDLRDVFAKKIGPVGGDIVYLGETSKKEHIYYTNNVTVFVGNSYASFIGSSHEERRKVRETLEQRLSIKLKEFKSDSSR